MATGGRFDGKVSVVTGGASGIGLAITRRLLGEGGRVVACDLQTDKLKRLEDEFGSAFLGVRADVHPNSRMTKSYRMVDGKYRPAVHRARRSSPLLLLARGGLLAFGAGVRVPAFSRRVISDPSDPWDAQGSPRGAVHQGRTEEAGRVW